MTAPICHGPGDRTVPTTDVGKHRENMRRPNVRTYILVLAISLWASLMSSVPAAAELLRAGPDVWSYGWLQVDVPEHWTVAGDTTYRFVSARSSDFVLLITPFPSMNSTSPEARCQDAQQTTEGIRAQLREIAADPEIPILAMDDRQACVRYVSIMDRTVTKPTNEDFKYGVQGAAAVGHLLATFTILTNTKDSPEVQAALGMIQGAKHLGGPADLGATAAAATRLSYPGKVWSLLVDLSGFKVEAPAVDERGTGLRFYGSSKDPLLVTSIFFEPADRGDDPKVYRAYYREVSFAAAPFKRERVRETGGDEMPLLWYTNVVGEIRHHNVNAFLVRDGLWIDVHLSTGLSVEESKRLFERFLGSMRFADDAAWEH